MNETQKKRYICSFVKKVGDEFVPNVVVVIASNPIIAKAVLCESYHVKNVMIDSSVVRLNSEEGIKSIRLSETNTYEGEESCENFKSNNPRL